MLKRKRGKGGEGKAESTLQVVGFRIGEELYGVDIHTIQEIDRMQSVTRLPKSLPFIEGVINLRGSIIPLIDVAKRFGLPATPVGRQTRIIVARIEGQVVGLIVEEVTEVIQLPEAAVEPAPAMAFAVDSRYVEGVGRMAAGLIILLSLARLFSAEELSALQTQEL